MMHKGVWGWSYLIKNKFTIMLYNSNMPSDDLNALHNLYENEFDEEGNEIIEFFKNLNQNRLIILSKKYSKRGYREKLIHLCRFVDYHYRTFAEKEKSSILFYPALRIIDRDKLNDMHSDEEWKNFGSGSNFRTVYSNSFVDDLVEDSLVEKKKILTPGKTSKYKWTHLKLSRVGWVLGLILEDELRNECKKNEIEFPINDNYFRLVGTYDANVFNHQPGLYLNKEADIKEFIDKVKTQLIANENIFRLTGESGAGKSNLVQLLYESQRFLDLSPGSEMVIVNFSKILSHENKEMEFIREIFYSLDLDSEIEEPANLTQLRTILIREINENRLFIAIDQFDHFIEYSLQFPKDSFVRNFLIKFIEATNDDNTSKIVVFLIYTDPNQFTKLLQNTEFMRTDSFRTDANYLLQGLSEEHLEMYFFENILKRLIPEYYNEPNFSKNMIRIYETCKNIIQILSGEDKIVNPFQFVVTGIHFLDYLSSNPLKNMAEIIEFDEYELRDFVLHNLLSFETIFRTIKNDIPSLYQAAISISEHNKKFGKKLILLDDEQLERIRESKSDNFDLHFILINNLLGFRHDLILEKFQQLNLDLDRDEKKLMEKIDFINEFNTIITGNREYLIPPSESLIQIYDNQESLNSLIEEGRIEKKKVGQILKALISIIEGQFPINMSLLARILEDPKYINQRVNLIKNHLMIQDELIDTDNILSKFAVNFWIEFRNQPISYPISNFQQIFTYLPLEDNRALLEYSLTNSNALPMDVILLNKLTNIFICGLKDSKYNPYSNEHIIDSIRNFENYNHPQKYLIMRLKFDLIQKFEPPSDLIRILTQLVNSKLDNNYLVPLMKHIKTKLETYEVLSEFEWITDWIEHSSLEVNQLIDDSTFLFLYYLFEYVKSGNIQLKHEIETIEDMLISIIDSNYEFTEINRRLIQRLPGINESKFDEYFKTGNELDAEFKNVIEKAILVATLEVYFELGFPLNIIKDKLIQIIQNHLSTNPKDLWKETHKRAFEGLYERLIKEEMKPLSFDKSISKIIDLLKNPQIKHPDFNFSPQHLIYDLIDYPAFEQLKMLSNWLANSWDYTEYHHLIMIKWFEAILRKIRYEETNLDYELIFTNLDDLFSENHSEQVSFTKKYFLNISKEIFNVISDDLYHPLDNVKFYSKQEFFTENWVDFWIFHFAIEPDLGDKLSHLPFTKKIFHLTDSLSNYFDNPSHHQLAEISNNETLYHVNEYQLGLSLLNKIIEHNMIEFLFEDDQNEFREFILNGYRLNIDLRGEFGRSIAYPILIKYGLSCFALLLQFHSSGSENASISDHSIDIETVEKEVGDISQLINNLISDQKQRGIIDNLVDLSYPFEYPLNIDRRYKDIVDHLKEPIQVSLLQSFLSKWTIVIFVELVEMISETIDSLDLSSYILQGLRSFFMTNRELKRIKQIIDGRESFSPYDDLSDETRTEVRELVQQLESDFEDKDHSDFLLYDILNLMQYRSDKLLKPKLFNKLFGPSDFSWIEKLILQESQVGSEISDLIEMEAIKKKLRSVDDDKDHQFELQFRGRDLGLIEPTKKLVELISSLTMDGYQLEEKWDLSCHAPSIFCRLSFLTLIRITTVEDIPADYHQMLDTMKDSSRQFIERCIITPFQDNQPKSKFTHCSRLQIKNKGTFWFNNRFYQEISRLPHESIHYLRMFTSSIVFIFSKLASKQGIMSIISRLEKEMAIVEEQIKVLNDEYYNDYFDRSLPINGPSRTPTKDPKINNLSARFQYLSEVFELLHQSIPPKYLSDNYIIKALDPERSRGWLPRVNNRNLDRNIIEEAIDRKHLHDHLIKYWRSLPTKGSHTIIGGGWIQSKKWSLIQEHPGIIPILYPRFIRETELFDFLLSQKSPSSLPTEDPLEPYYEFIPPYLIRKFNIYRRFNRNSS